MKFAIAGSRKQKKIQLTNCYWMIFMRKDDFNRHRWNGTMRSTEKEKQQEKDDVDERAWDRKCFSHLFYLSSLIIFRETIYISSVARVTLSLFFLRRLPLRSFVVGRRRSSGVLVNFFFLRSFGFPSWWIQTSASYLYAT